jgi:2'-5' RNA ligase
MNSINNIPINSLWVNTFYGLLSFSLLPYLLVTKNPANPGLKTYAKTSEWWKSRRIKTAQEVAIKYLVSLPIPEPAESLIADIKSSLKPLEWRDTMDPHITVLAPGDPLLSEDEAAKAFRKACAGLHGISIGATQLRHFARRNHRTIYLKPMPAKPLQSLFETLLDQATWQEIGASIRRPYYPHITLVTQLPTGPAIEAEEELQALNLDLSFKLTKVCLYAKQKSWPKWQVVAESPLKIGE